MSTAVAAAASSSSSSSPTAATGGLLPEDLQPPPPPAAAAAAAVAAAAAAVDLQYLLPADIWRSIFCFVGNARDLLQLEQTCRRFRRLIEEDDDDDDDDLLWVCFRRVISGNLLIINPLTTTTVGNADCWKICPGSTAEVYSTSGREYTDMSSHRARACLHYVTNELIHNEQQKTDNIFESELGERLWVDLIHSIVRRAVATNDFGPALFLVPGRIEQYAFNIRGDASFYLIEMVQQVLIAQFQRANYMMLAYRVEGERHRQYPVLKSNDLYTQGQLQLGPNHLSDQSQLEHLLEQFDEATSKSMFPFQGVPGEVPETTALATALLNDFSNNGLTMDRIAKMVRRLARRAGVVKVSAEVYMTAWKSIVYAILAILLPACHDSVSLHDGNDDDDENMRVQLHSHQRIRDVPPFPYLDTPGSSSNNNIVPIRHFFLVPGQLEETARHLTSCLASQEVYEGDGWHVVDPALTRDQEMENAYAMYDFVQVDLIIMTPGFEPRKVPLVPGIVWILGSGPWGPPKAGFLWAEVLSSCPKHCTLELVVGGGHAVKVTSLDGVTMVDNGQIVPNNKSLNWLYWRDHSKLTLLGDNGETHAVVRFFNSKLKKALEDDDVSWTSCHATTENGDTIDDDDTIIDDDEEVFV